MKRSDASARVVLATLALLVFYVAVGVASDRGLSRNQRHENVFVRGSGIQGEVGAAIADGDSLSISSLPNSAVSSATWNVSSYEVAHLLSQARACTVSILFVGTSLTSTLASGSADILFDGAIIRHIGFSAARKGFYAVAPGRFFPDDITPSLIDVVALDRRYGFSVTLPAGACRSSDWMVGVRTHNVNWIVSAVGLSLTYTPNKLPLLGNNAITIILGIILAAALSTLLLYVVSRCSLIGKPALFAASGVIALAAVTHDQWDFPLWIRFSELASFGAANPANLWSASPLWAFVPSLFSSITLASYIVTGDGSRSLTELLLKLGLALAYCYNASVIAGRAPLKLRSFYALTALLIPSGLYEVAGGYREPIAGALIFFAISLARRRKLILSTIAMCAGASISESLLAMVFFPATIVFLDRSRPGRAVYGLALAALGFGLFLAEWVFLIQRDAARSALTWRFGSAHYGGASWAGALEGLHLLPAWIPARAPVFGIAVFVALSSLPILRLVRSFRDPASSHRSLSETLLGTFIAFVAAFFLAFRGVDPNMWYLIIILALYYFAKAEPSNPFPLLLGVILGFAFYGEVGLGDFVNQSLLWPFDRGLLGILGVSRFVFDLMLSGLTLCLIVGLSSGNTRILFSAKSPWYLALFGSAVATTAIRSYPLDLVVCGAVLAIALHTFYRQIASRRRNVYTAPRFMYGGGVAVITALGAICGTQSAAAGLTTSGALVVALTSGFGLCDIVLVSGASGVLASQAGFGWLSTVGWIMLSTIILVAVVSSARRGTGSRQSR